MGPRVWRVWGCVAVASLALLGCASTTGTKESKPVATGVEAASLADGSGISYVAAGQLMALRDGQAERVATKAPVQALGTGADAGGLVVRDTTSAQPANISWYSPETGKLTDLRQSSEGGSLGSVRFLSKLDSVWFSVFGDPDASLKSATPAGADAQVRALGSSFNGEFDVDSRGETIAFVGAGQNPSTLTLKDGEGESVVPTKLALIFTPDLSADGTTLCFVGGQSAADLSVWVLDRSQGKLRDLSKTRGLKPTVPVFSADGARVAFRGAEDGSLWIVDVASGTPKRLPIVADEGPIGW